MRCGSRSSAAVATTVGNSPSALRRSFSRSCGEQPRVEVLAPLHAQLGRVAQQRCDPRVSVPDIVDRVVVGVPRDLVDVQRQRRVGRRPGQRVAGGVHADRVDDLVERDERAGPLGKFHRLATLDQTDQLSDEDLDVEVGIVAGTGRDRLEPVDVAVVVGPEQVDALVEATLALVDVVRRSRRRSTSSRRCCGSARGRGRR